MPHAVSVLIVALVAFSVRRWFLDGRRPDLVQSVLLGVVLTVLHMSLEVLFGHGDIGSCCGYVFTYFVSEAVMMTLALTAACVASRSVGGFGSFFSSSPSRLLAVYLLIAGVQVWLAAHEARREMSRRGDDALMRLEYVFDSQIEFMLHHDAVQIAESIGTLKHLSTAEIARIADNARYDEICLVNPSGRIECCNDEKLRGFDFSAHPKAREYLSLVDDRDAYICEPFRASGLDGVKVKYGGVGLPDGSGFLQLGYYRKRLERDFRRYFAPIFHEQIGYASGDYYLIVTKSDGRILVADLEHDPAEGMLISDVGFAMDSVYAKVFGEWCHMRWHDVGEYRIFCVTPVSATFGGGLYECAVLLPLIFVFVFAFRVVMLRLRNQQAKIDRMRAEADEKRRQDMDMAARIQVSSLPMSFPSGDGFSFFAKMKTAREVGGDFFDFYRLADGRIVFTIADVSGKGVPAAMFMMRAKGTVKSSLFRHADLAAAIANANDRLSDNNEAQMFVTAWIGVFDPSAMVVEFVNAGHNPPVVRHADGSVEWLRTRGGLALGVFPGCRFRSGRISLSAGDSLLLYTDGVTEAQDVSGGFYGEKRLEAFLSGSRGDRVNALFADIAAFAGAAEQADDITAVVLEIC